MTSEIVWAVIFIVGFCWEMVGVFRERQWGIEPLTTIVRDRLMRNPFIWLGVFAFWLWLGVHFFIEGAL